MQMLILVRGLPGSGKSTIASRFHMATCEVNGFFTDSNGKYTFDSSKLPIANERCQKDTERYLMQGYSVVVANIFSQLWELKPYFEMANRLSIPYTVIDLFDNGCTDAQLASRTIHNVPMETISRMRYQWEKYSCNESGLYGLSSSGK